MKRELKSVGMSLGVAVAVLAPVASPASATPHAEVSAGKQVTAQRAWDCHRKGWLCLWDRPHYKYRKSAWEAKAFSDLKCGKGAYYPYEGTKSLPQSVRNRTGKTWYGLSSHNKRIVSVGSGSRKSSLSSWRSIEKWCWK
ncbi:hypothetical protein [Streptomyces decoyicus]|uniref:hypothetical protein n=1 Tax=Streptomyces decoyicus TaxID=249567 RepID=UPI0004AAF277